MKQMLRLLIVMVMTASFLIGCTVKETGNEEKNEALKQTQEEMPTTAINNEEKNGQQALVVAEETTQTETMMGEDKNQPVSSNQQADTGKQQVANANATNDTKANMKADQSLEQEQSVSANNSYHSATNPKVEEKKESNVEENEVTIAIKGDAETGIILKSTKVAFKAGDTVLDILKNETKRNRIQMEYRGGGGTAYIEGINNLYEFDKGPKSGWMYSINDVFMKKGSGLAEVKQGDKIEWVYTLDLGKDIGATMNE